MIDYNYPINRHRVLIDGTPRNSYSSHLLSRSPLSVPSFHTFVGYLCVRDSIAIDYLVTTFDVHRVLKP
jgi:hypothetical protein